MSQIKSIKIPLLKNPLRITVYIYIISFILANIFGDLFNKKYKPKSSY